MALTDLHDDLLRRILYFTPAKEGASTIARRWRSLWPSSGAVNLDSFSYSSGRQHDDQTSEDAALSGGAFLRGAEAALAASHAPVRNLTVNVEGQTKRGTSIYQVLDAVLSNPAARYVEQLRIRVSQGSPVRVHVPNLNLGSLPFESLRRLDVGMCHCQSHTPADLEFPRLEVLRLYRCVLPTKHLQAMIDAAPLLTSLQLYEVQLVVPCKRILCPRVTNLVLADLYWQESSWREGMELDAPMLRDFTYRGFIRPFSFEPTLAEITKVELHFYGDNNHHQSHDERCQLFWEFVRNFGSTKILKLRLVHLEHITVADKRKTTELLRDTVFSNLHRLDLQAFYTPGRKAGGVAFAAFLRCCPVIRVLVLELTTVDGDPYKRASHVQGFVNEEGKSDLCNSVDHFIRPQIKFMQLFGWRR